MTLLTASAWRLELAREIADRLRGAPGLRAVVVGGSVARGYADEYSDLEIPLFWEELPADAERRRLAERLGADYLYPYNGPAQEDNLLVNGFQVDLWHNTVAEEETLMARILREQRMDLGESNFMDTLRYCIPLEGAEIIARWKEQAAQYPDGLAAWSAQQAIDAMRASHLALQVSRANPTLFYGQISELQQNLFLLLLALNRRYFPTFKWLYPVLDELTLKPADLAGRFRRAYTGDPAAAALDAAAWVEETLTLARAQFPDLNVDELRGQLKFSRARHVSPVRL